MTSRRLTRIGTVLESDGVRVVGFAHQRGDCSGCGAAAVCRAAASRNATVSAETLGLGNLGPGTRVEISVRERGLNRAALWLFGAPLLLLLTAAHGGAVLAASAGWPPQVAAPLAGCLGLVLALGAVRSRARSLLAALDLRGAGGPGLD